MKLRAKEASIRDSAHIAGIDRRLDKRMQNHTGSANGDEIVEQSRSPVYCYVRAAKRENTGAASLSAYINFYCQKETGTTLRLSFLTCFIRIKKKKKRGGKSQCAAWTVTDRLVR